MLWCYDYYICLFRAYWNIPYLGRYNNVRLRLTIWSSLRILCLLVHPWILHPPVHPDDYARPRTTRTAAPYTHICDRPPRHLHHRQTDFTESQQDRMQSGEGRTSAVRYGYLCCMPLYLPINAWF